MKWMSIIYKVWGRLIHAVLKCLIKLYTRWGGCTLLIMIWSIFLIQNLLQLQKVRFYHDQSSSICSDTLNRCMVLSTVLPQERKHISAVWWLQKLPKEEPVVKEWIWIIVGRTDPESSECPVDSKCYIVALTIGPLLSQGTELCKIICLPGSVQVTYTLRAAASLVAGEPNGPTVKTDIPGPKSRQLLAELSAIQVNGSFIHLQLGI